MHGARTSSVILGEVRGDAEMSASPIARRGHMQAPMTATGRFGTYESELIRTDSHAATFALVKARSCAACAKDIPNSETSRLSLNYCAQGHSHSIGFWPTAFFVRHPRV